MKKKLLSLILSLAMIVTMMPVMTMTAYATTNHTFVAPYCDTVYTSSTSKFSFYYPEGDYWFSFVIKKPLSDLSNGQTYSETYTSEKAYDQSWDTIDLGKSMINGKDDIFYSVSITLTMNSAGDLYTANVVCQTPQGDEPEDKYTISYKAYDVYLTSTTHGTLKLLNGDDSGVYPVDGYVDLELVPDEGYIPDKVQYNDGTYHDIYGYKNGSKWSYSFIMPDSAVSVSATFVLEGEEDDPEPEPDPDGKTYTLYLNQATSDKWQYKSGETVTVRANDPAEGMEFDRWTVVSGTLDISSQEKNTTMTFKMPNCDLSLKANFKTIGSDDPEKPKYFITVDSGGNGSAWADVLEAEEGTVVKLTTQPNDGYKFKEWQVLSGGITITNNQFTVGKSDVRVKAIFEAIKMDEKIDLSNASVTIAAQKYTGKKLKPEAEVVVDGMLLTAGKDYTITYSNNKSVGKATATITGIGYYEGTAKGYFKINPKGTSISKLTASKKAFTAKWKAQKTQTSGYQIRYSTSSSMSGAKSKTISSNKTTSKKVSSLKAKKKYYVQIRTYKTVKGVKYYSSWSSKKTVTPKK